MQKYKNKNMTKNLWKKQSAGEQQSEYRVSIHTTALKTVTNQNISISNIYSSRLNHKLSMAAEEAANKFT